MDDIGSGAAESVEKTEENPTNGDLSEVEFVNMVLRVETGANGYISRAADFRQLSTMEPVPPGFEKDVETIRRQTCEKMGDPLRPRRFVVTAGEMRFRAIPLYPTEDGKVWYSYRRIPPAPKPLDKLNFGPLVLRQLRRIMARDGLILVAGTFGEGKTTTCSSLLADYQARTGGFAITVERPIEYPISDPESDRGLCLQIAADDFTEADWERVTSDIRKASPSIVMIGEISDAHTAKAALRLASLGRPVLATAHGGSHREVILNLVEQAKSAQMAQPEDAVAGVITAIVHQTLVEGRPETRTVEATTPYEDPLRQAIRKLDYKAIEAEGQDQHRRLLERGEETDHA